MTDPDVSTAAGLRLGNILYSNCFPVHARLIDRPEAGDPALVDGIPSALNAKLASGEIDVSPSSSIEYARHADRYGIISGVVIGSRGPVRSILLVSDVDPTDLGGKVVALPTASATSVVLLKILLRIRWEVDPIFVWFDQARDDPFADGAAAALFIGDVALRPDLYSEKRVRLDLGAEWWDETGLPFAFAVWQSASGTDAQLSDLHDRLVSSLAYFNDNRSDLATRYAAHFGLPARLLEEYWRGLSYDLDEPMLEGLGAFFRMAADIGEVTG
ncbi:MAG TPA: menaquinone biosynthesis protein [Longimicrobiaceae bacterium]|nr:menaquinone biosynthesis protein [Longimicrobiaceae bacterium]